jgi:hypothetical protein
MRSEMQRLEISFLEAFARMSLTVRGTVSIFKCIQINSQAHEFRWSFHPGVFQGIIFIHREIMVKEVDNSPSCIY